MADSVTQRALRRRWPDDDKLTLALLVREYPARQKRAWISAIWNQIHRQQLLIDGFPDGTLPTARLKSQINEMKRGGTGSILWQQVMRCPAARIKRIYAVQSAMIDAAERELAAQNSNMTPVARPDDWSDSSDDEEHLNGLLYDDNAHNKPSINNAKVNGCMTQQRQVSPEHEDMTELLRRPLSRPLLRQQHAIGNYTVTCPVLLFRGFEPAHGLRARRFAEIGSLIPAPPQFSSVAYKNAIHPHLERTIPYDSPVLSLAQNPINALKWVGRDERDLAILLLQDVGEDALARYGDVGAAYPYLANAIIREHNLNDLPGRYVGRGEFLAWGSIECQPIAVYKNEDAVLLRDTMKSMKYISEVTAERLAPHLARVSDKYKELVAYSFLRSFKVKGYQKCPLGDDYDDFIATIYAFTYGDRAASVVSTVNPATLRASIPPGTSQKAKHSDDEVDNGNEDDETEDEHDLSSGSENSEAVQRPIYWHNISTTSNGLHISQASLYRTSSSSDQSLASETSSTQAAVDAQILRELDDYSLDITERTSHASNTFTNQLLHAATQSSPTPAPPETSATSVIDLTSSDQEDSNTTSSSLGSRSTPIKLDDEDVDEDEEYITVASGSRQHMPLSLRTQSTSEPIETPTRPPKRKIANR